MKIAHVLWALGTGGAETMLVDIVNEQVKDNDVMIVAINDLINEKLVEKIDSRCKVVLLRRKIGSKNMMPWVKMNWQLLTFRPDIIHCHLEGFRKMIFHPAPKVFTIHNITTSGREYPSFKQLYAISDAVKHYTETQGFESVTVHNGIHPDMIELKTNIEAFDVCKTVCVGRLFNDHKGQDVLIKAADILLNKYGVTNFHIDLIGDGPSRKILEGMIEESNLAQHVELLGQKDRTYVYSHLKDYDLYVMPSRFEGFGLTVAEAVCAKVPVLVCDLEGPMEVIEGGKYGLHFKCGDAEDLAVQLQAFIKYGADVELVEKAYAYAHEHFDIKRTAQQYVEEYKRILN